MHTKIPPHATGWSYEQSERRVQGGSWILMERRRWNGNKTRFLLMSKTICHLCCFHNRCRHPVKPRPQTLCWQFKHSFTRSFIFCCCSGYHTDPRSGMDSGTTASPHLIQTLMFFHVRIANISTRQSRKNKKRNKRMSQVGEFSREDAH